MSRSASHNQFEYGVECFAHAGAAATDIGAIRDAFDRGCLDIFLVDQKSVSGGIFPMGFLKGQGIPACDKQALERPGGALNHVFYTGSQKECVKALCGADDNAGASRPERVRIGFVSDYAFQAAVVNGQPIQRVRLEGLEAIRIPGSAVVVRTSFYQQHRELLDRLPLRTDFTRLPQYEEKYDLIRRWRNEFLPEPPTSSERTDWPNFFRQLEAYMQEQKRVPRIALVLAGGGAKCAFQVGVVRAIEKEFRRYRDEDFPNFARANKLPPDKFGIGLVVGTSGGALNALPTALGTYTSDAGVQTMRSAWQSLDARDILQPELAVRMSVGVLLFLIQLVAVLFLVRVPWLAPADRPRTPRPLRGRAVLSPRSGPVPLVAVRLEVSVGLLVPHPRGVVCRVGGGRVRNDGRRRADAGSRRAGRAARPPLATPGPLPGDVAQYGARNLRLAHADHRRFHRPARAPLGFLPLAGPRAGGSDLANGRTTGQRTAHRARQAARPDPRFGGSRLHDSG